MDWRAFLEELRRGLDLKLFAAGAVFAVGLGFAMQNIVQNFVSGVILMVERTIKPDDVLEVEGDIVRVQKMRIRATMVRTRNEEELIIPNSTLVQGAVKNYTLTDSRFLLGTVVGVTYGSDMQLVREVLTRNHDRVPPAGRSLRSADREIPGKDIRGLISSSSLQISRSREVA
jgi:potassium-dependent mechanosensitive channel